MPRPPNKSVVKLGIEHKQSVHGPCWGEKKGETAMHKEKMYFHTHVCSSVYVCVCAYTHIQKYSGITAPTVK